MAGQFRHRPVYRWGLLGLLSIGLSGYQPLLTVLFLFAFLALQAERGTVRAHAGA